MDKYTEFAIAGMLYVGGSIYSAYKACFVKKEKAILVLRTDAIGDMTCSSAFLRELRSSYPQHRITLLCNPMIKNMVECCPYVDEILTYDNRVNKHRFMTNVKRSLKFAREHLQKRNFELAILPYHANTGIYPDLYISLFSGARKRFGYSELVNKDKHEYFMGLHDRFLNCTTARKDVYHEVESTLKLLEYITGKTIICDNVPLELWTNDEDEKYIADLLQKMGASADKLNIIVNLSTSNKTKDWAIENYIAVCQRLNVSYEINFLLIGAGDVAMEYAEQFCKQIPEAYNLVNKTSLRQTAQLIKQSRVYIGGDTGPLHIAAAFGLTGVAIYKNAKNIRTRPRPDEWYGPWQSEIRVIQPQSNLPGCEDGCGKDGHCINQVTVDTVFAEIDAILKDLL